MRVERSTDGETWTDVTQEYIRQRQGAGMSEDSHSQEAFLRDMHEGLRKAWAEREALQAQLHGERQSHLQQMDDWRIEKEMLAESRDASTDKLAEIERRVRDLLAERDALQAEVERLQVERDRDSSRERELRELSERRRARVEQLEQALRAVEWGEDGACPDCNGFAGRRPHTPDCVVGIALRRSDQ